MAKFKNIISSLIDKTSETVKTLYKGSQLTQGNVEIYSDMESMTKLRHFQNKFFQSKGIWEQNWTLIDERESIYNGTHSVDLNINEKSKTKTQKLSNNVRNIVYELIESAVDNSIPMPTVRSKTDEGKALAVMIEDSIKNDLLDSKINKLNDKSERTTMKHGYSATGISWNPDFKHHLFRGEIEFNSIHPKQIIPQANVYDIDKMDYIFVLYSRTKGQIKRTYGVDLQAEREQFPEVNYVPDDENNINSQYEKVTEIVCFYYDEDGDVGKFSWVNNVVLEDLPKYYYRRDDKGNIMESETLIEDVTLSRTEPVLDANGQPVMQVDQQGQPTGQPQVKPVVIPAGTEVPYFVPRSFPVIVRINVPSDFGFGGISDIDSIRDQQDVVKKLTNNIEEKILRGGSIITKLNDHKVELTDKLNQVISGTQAQLTALNVKTMQANIAEEVNFLQLNYEAAKDTLGITNAWQGKSDYSNESGKINQQKIQQSGGRMQSKMFNKYDFYKQLFEMDFYFKLAYYDELRPYVTKDDNGKDSYGDFNKYEFLVQDKAGEWYYNTDFLFTADAGDGIPRDKMWLFNNNTDMYKIGAYNPGAAAVTFWNQMDSMKYPNAKETLAQIQQAWDAQMQMIKNAPPKVTMAFRDMSPEAQSQELQKVGINVPPEVLKQYIETAGDQPPGSTPRSGQQAQDNPYHQIISQLTPDELAHLHAQPEHVMNELKLLQNNK